MGAGWADTSTTVEVRMNRDSMLRLVGWIHAHRPPGDWEPPFLVGCLMSFERAARGPEDDMGYYDEGRPGPAIAGNNHDAGGGPAPETAIAGAE